MQPLPVAAGTDAVKCTILLPDNVQESPAIRLRRGSVDHLVEYDKLDATIQDLQEQIMILTRARLRIQEHRASQTAEKNGTLVLAQTS